jgi:hypothetical protein
MKVMKAYQVFKGDEDKHGFQQYYLIETFLDFKKAEFKFAEIVNSTPLYGDELEIHSHSVNDEVISLYATARGWTFVDIAKIEKIEITE